MSADDGDRLIAMHALKLRREVTSLRHDLDGIRSMMQNMHREVNSSVLLFDRLAGVGWDPGNTVRLAEDQRVSATRAMDRLVTDINTLERRLDVAENSKSRGDADVEVTRDGRPEEAK